MFEKKDLYDLFTEKLKSFTDPEVTTPAKEWFNFHFKKIDILFTYASVSDFVF